MPIAPIAAPRLSQQPYTGLEMFVSGQTKSPSPRRKHSSATSAGGSLTIGYWNIRGLGAPLRMMAEYAGADYEAKLHDSDTDEWAELKAELIKTNPLANLPYVIDGDTVVTQSNACFAYLGEKFGLLGSDATERVQCEQCLCQVMDLRNEGVELFYGRGVSVSPGGISPSEHGAAYCALPSPVTTPAVG